MSRTFVLSEQDAIRIFNKFKFKSDAVLKSYSVRRASDKMLGFLSDYWKLEMRFTTSDKEIHSHSFFIKSLPHSNESKTQMVKDLKLFDQESFFYTMIKEKINLPDLAPWSANLVTKLNDALVLEDLNFLQYRMRNKHETFDEEHILLALQALARFHAGTLVYEERTRKQLNNNFVIHEEYKEILNRGGFIKSDPWFTQCMNGALEAIKSFSKYKSDSHVLKEIENTWTEVWHSALDVSHLSLEYRNVICHRDLWNNNILFRYNDDTEGDERLVPDNCVLVDFQGATCQPPAGDVMFLLCCNLERKFREENITTFLNYYYRQLHDILEANDVTLTDIMSLEQFLSSCKKYKLWGLVVTSCLVPQFWVDDDLTVKYFSDADSFGQILSKDKGSFIKKMMASNDGYKNKVMQVFEEIVDSYCLGKEHC